MAETKAFTHALDTELLAAHVPHTARILDLGCGYGRLTAALHDGGWHRVLGADTALGMIERARRGAPLARVPALRDGRLAPRDGRVRGLHFEEREVVTMNGNAARGFQ